MSSPRGDKPAKARPSLDGGPSFDADSLVVPDEVHREGMGGGRRPQKRASGLPGWVIPAGVGVVVIAGLAIWLGGRGGSSSSTVVPIDDPEPSAQASPSPAPTFPISASFETMPSASNSTAVRLSFGSVTSFG